MRFSPALSTLAITIFALGCSSPKNLTMTAATKDKVVEKVAKSKMTEEEKKLFVTYLMRAEVSKNLPGLTGGAVSWEGKTVGQIIEEQRKFQTEQQAKEAQAAKLAADAKAKEEAIAAELRKVINLSVYSIKVEAADRFGISQYLNMKCAYENTGTKNIRAFQGTIVFRDLFGEVISRSHLKITDSIAAGAKGTWEGGHDYNQYKESDRKLANSDLKDLKIEWVPETVIFEDGSRIGEDSHED